MLNDNFIGGRWARSRGDARVDVINPATERRIADVPAGDPADVHDAVEAARRAQPAWSRVGLDERLDLLSALADHLEARQDEITDIVVAEVGTPRRVARWAQVGFGILDLRTAVASARQFEWETKLENSLIVRDPVGVAGCITPWNYPLHQITAKIGAALAAGCTVVVKASEVAPLTARALAESIEQVGLPPGVFNLVNGVGSTVGEALVAHPDVDLVSFTGSNQVGRQVAQLAVGSVKRLALELGGKSASVVLDDADLDTAVRMTMRSSYMNAGQSCNAQTRMLVPALHLDEAEQIARDVAASYAPGDPTDPATKLGPIVSAKQHDRVLAYIQRGLDDGARLVTGGTERPSGLDVGYFVQPTVFSSVAPDSAIAQEEIFGPVLSVIPYESDEQAVEIANGTIYGIAAAVWSSDDDRAAAVARRLAAAQVDVNGGGFNPAAPFGGYKQSGLGREGGAFGIDEYVEIKSLQF